MLRRWDTSRCWTMRKNPRSVLNKTGQEKARREELVGKLERLCVRSAGQQKRKSMTMPEVLRRKAVDGSISHPNRMKVLEEIDGLILGEETRYLPVAQKADCADSCSTVRRSMSAELLEDAEITEIW